RLGAAEVSVRGNARGLPIVAEVAGRQRDGIRLESIEDGVNQSISGRGAGILGDVGPDLVEVLLGKGGQPIGHLRLLGASRTTARLDPLGELSTRRPVVRTSLASWANPRRTQSCVYET